MNIILIIILVLISWAILSTVINKTLNEKFDLNDEIIGLSTIFSPISFFIIIGVLIGKFIIEELPKIFKNENEDD